MTIPANPLTPSPLEEVKKALEGITPLPWEPCPEEMYIFAGKGQRMVADDGGFLAQRERVARIRGFGGGEPQERNLHAIATVMNNAPWMVARIEELAAQSLEAAQHFAVYDICPICTPVPSGDGKGKQLHLPDCWVGIALGLTDAGWLRPVSRIDGKSRRLAEVSK